MSKDTDYVATLIDFTVSDDNERVDLEACLEISDRVNATKPECQEAIKCIAKCMGKSNLKVVMNTLQLLETLCKNCNMRFLYELNNKKLVDAMVKHLQRRRDKAKYKVKDSKIINPLKNETEERILYLLQLWADTFMMHQAEFRNIHDAYRNLRKDGVQFPDRDINQRYMINFQGQQSPVFLAMEANFIVPSNNQGGPVNDRKKIEPIKKVKAPEYKHEVQNTLYDENDEDYDYSAYDGIQITPDEINVLEKSMNVLREIEKTATKPTDMKGEVAKEILSDLVHVHKRLKRFIKSEKFLNTAHRNEAIKLNHNLTLVLSNYKTKYYKLKEEGRRVKTEADEDFSRKYRDDDEFSGTRNVNRLATEMDEHDRRPFNDFGFKPPGNRSNVGNKAPADPWKSSLEAEKQNLGHNPDLVDLLNTTQTQNKNKPKFEERKEDTKSKPGAQKIVHDLLDIDFGTEPSLPTSSKSKNLIENNDLENKKKLQNPAQQQQRNFNTYADNTSYKKESLNTAPSMSNDVFDFRNAGVQNFSTPKTGKSGMGIPQPKFASPKIGSPLGFTQPQFKQPAVTRNVVTMSDANDDDDFFSDIANRKR